jgi:hypothetical protein
VAVVGVVRVALATVDAGSAVVGVVRVALATVDAGTAVVGVVRVALATVLLCPVEATQPTTNANAKAKLLGIFITISLLLDTGTLIGRNFSNRRI